MKISTLHPPHGQNAEPNLHKKKEKNPKRENCSTAEEEAVIKEELSPTLNPPMLYLTGLTFSYFGQPFMTFKPSILEDLATLPHV